MFCFQCEQTAGCSGCTGAAGVCGKKSVTADFNRMTGSLKHEIYFMDAVGVRHLADTAALIASMRFSATSPRAV